MAENELPVDKVLLAQVAEGDEHAFRLLFDAYKDKVYSFAYQFTKSVVQSEEVVQEVFLKIWLKKETVTTIENFRAWLFMVTRNHSLNVLKKIAYDYSYRKGLPAEPEADSVEDELQLKEYKRLVNEAVEQLPAQQKKIYRLRRDQGLKIDEIAGELGLSSNTVKVHLTKALKNIRTELEGKLDLIVALILTTIFLD